MSQDIVKSHLLVVEDDVSLSRWICDYLKRNNFDVSAADRGDVAVNMIKRIDPDLVVLDLMLPEKDGFQVCSEVRQFYPKPILMMTAFSEDSDEEKGFDLGADDYIRKPVRPKILLARINALLRRSEHLKTEAVKMVGSLKLDSQTKIAYNRDTNLGLTTNEFDVLWLLAHEAGKVVSRTDLISRLRGIEYDGFDRSIDIRVSRLRKKLGDDQNDPQKIRTIWGKGYLFSPEAWAE